MKKYIKILFYGFCSVIAANMAIATDDGDGEGGEAPKEGKNETPVPPLEGKGSLLWALEEAARLNTIIKPSLIGITQNPETEHYVTALDYQNLRQRGHGHQPSAQSSANQNTAENSAFLEGERGKAFGANLRGMFGRSSKEKKPTQTQTTQPRSSEDREKDKDAKQKLENLRIKYLHTHRNSLDELSNEMAKTLIQKLKTKLGIQFLTPAGQLVEQEATKKIRAQFHQELTEDAAKLNNHGNAEEDAKITLLDTEEETPRTAERTPDENTSVDIHQGRAQADTEPAGDGTNKPFETIIPVSLLGTAATIAAGIQPTNRCARMAGATGGVVGASLVAALLYSLFLNLGYI